MPPSHRSVLSRFSLQQINLPAVHMARLHMAMPCITGTATMLMRIIRFQNPPQTFSRTKIIIFVNINDQKFGSTQILIWINP